MSCFASRAYRACPWNPFEVCLVKIWYFLKNVLEVDVYGTAKMMRMFTVHLSYRYFGIFTSSSTQLESNKIWKIEPVTYYLNQHKNSSGCWKEFEMVLGQRLNKKTCSIKTSSTWMWFCCGIPRRARHETNCRSTKSTKLDSNLKTFRLFSINQFGRIWMDILIAVGYRLDSVGHSVWN